MRATTHQRMVASGALQVVIGILCVAFVFGQRPINVFGRVGRLDETSSTEARYITISFILSIAIWSALWDRVTAVLRTTDTGGVRGSFSCMVGLYMCLSKTAIVLNCIMIISHFISVVWHEDAMRSTEPLPALQVISIAILLLGIGELGLAISVSGMPEYCCPIVQWCCLRILGVRGYRLLLAFMMIIIIIAIIGNYTKGDHKEEIPYHYYEYK